MLGDTHVCPLTCAVVIADCLATRGPDGFGVPLLASVACFPEVVCAPRCTLIHPGEAGTCMVVACVGGFPVEPGFVLAMCLVPNTPCWHLSGSTCCVGMHVHFVPLVTTLSAGFPEVVCVPGCTLIHPGEAGSPLRHESNCVVPYLSSPVCSPWPAMGFSVGVSNFFKLLMVALMPSSWPARGVS